MIETMTPFVDTAILELPTVGGAALVRITRFIRTIIESAKDATKTIWRGVF